MSEKEYLVLRYSLVEDSQKSFDSKPVPDIKGQAILCAIQNDREFKSNGVIFSIVGFHPIEPQHGYEFPGNRFYLGKLAKLKKQQTGEKVPGDIVEFEHDNWIPITVIIDTETQHIFARKEWRFGSTEHIAKSIQAAFSEPILSIYNHKIFVEGKSKPRTFWNIVEAKSKIYRLDFKLISPNILDTNQKAREALVSLKEIFGQEEIDISLKNESGKLKIPQNPISNYLEYIAEGEGSWNLVTEGESGGKKAYSSNENIDTVELPTLKGESVDDAQLSLDQASNRNKPTNHDEAHLGVEIYAAIKIIEKD